MRVLIAMGVVVLIGSAFAASASAVPGPGGGLTVREAQNSKLTGVLRVRGFVRVDHDGRVRLCERLVGTPPTCSGVSIAVAGTSALQLGTLKHARGIAWSDRQRALNGRMRQGRLIVAQNVVSIS